MKCKNCGTVNPDGALKCKECNVPLTGSMLIKGENSQQVEQGTILCKNCKTANPATALRCLKCNAPFDGSLAVRPEEVKLKSETQKLDSSKQDWTVRNCPSCGYPNKSIADDCVSCGSSLYPTLNVKKENEPSSPKPIVPPIPFVKSSETPVVEKKHTKDTAERSQSAGNLHKTINPWIDSEPESKKFSLELLDTDFKSQGKTLEFEGDQIQLNRTNLESENSTITQKCQAEICKQDGKWVITDQSDMKTTFIKTEPNHPLKDGDIILMGNRLFKFSEEK